MATTETHNGYEIEIDEHGVATVNHNGARVAGIAGPARTWAGIAETRTRRGFVHLYQPGTRLNVGSCRAEHWAGVKAALAMVAR